MLHMRTKRVTTSLSASETATRARNTGIHLPEKAPASCHGWHQRLYASILALAISEMRAKAAESDTAMSASIFRSISTPARFKP